ncbi:hypothetical protein MP228_011666 [Amoeboaphelidium protococcarum]|nr:hypothetical protein MP228_011666 [Amoeboaphelidium protococcarum]
MMTVNVERISHFDEESNGQAVDDQYAHLPSDERTLARMLPAVNWIDVLQEYTKRQSLRDGNMDSRGSSVNYSKKMPHAVLSQLQQQLMQMYAQVESLQQLMRILVRTDVDAIQKQIPLGECINDGPHYIRSVQIQEQKDKQQDAESRQLLHLTVVGDAYIKASERLKDAAQSLRQSVVPSSQ